MTQPILLWSVFHLVLAVMLYLDLWVVNRRAHTISIREAAIWSCVWIVVSLIFCGWSPASIQLNWEGTLRWGSASCRR